MSPIEEKVTALLAELAMATPVEVGTPPTQSTAAGPQGRARQPDYVPIEAPAERARRRPVLVAVAAVLVVVVVGGLLVLGRGIGRSPVVASRSDIPVDTASLGDGRMAVVIENDLYVADGLTGQVWRLTDTGRGEEVSNVSFSHDGEWVAFTIHDESGLWVSRWDGAERHRIGRAPSSYAWSPTDDQLAYATQNEVRVAQTDGSSRALKVSAAPKPFTRVVWSPAGTGVAFVHVGGGTTREALDDTAEPEWGSTYTVPASEVVAWPSAELLAVVSPAQEPNVSLEVALMLSVETRQLTTIPAFLEIGTSDGGRRIASRTFGSPELVDCDTVELFCQRLPLDEGLLQASVPSYTSGGDRLAIVGDNVVGEETLQVVSPDRPAVRILLGSWTEPASGLVLEPPVWIDDQSLLVRVDSSSVVRVDVATGERTTVVEGERFLAPADDYPGGTGLAYWSRP